MTQNVFRAAYLNAPDISDPENRRKVLCLVILWRYVKLTWEWPRRHSALPGKPALLLTIEFGSTVLERNK